ncbi:RNA polymerase sigma factor [Allomuricauda sp. SCSIO 65647]|uniref:RNA polymerase sigma factor n=1 Tax=Allomuricauda sp. SCSIO 65647 TaxID=2908843 RepID=UPI001F31D4FB|nr:RNA polymerase sigma-70 factor [Muricauda sp. SCSIO 65647]UJH67045.1 RNA polymerase sigma-70 factor [Muricauda sp. SCSIO 65647]
MAETFSNNIFLIERLKNGDETAYTYLVDTHHQRLCTFANSLVNDSHQAQDIVQNVFLGLWRKRKGLPDDFNIRSFLSSSVYNEFIDQYRKNQSLLALEKKYIEALQLANEEKDSETIEQLVSIVKEEIKALPPKCKQVFVLSRQEGLTNIEISEYLKISIKTVEGHITRAFSILRKKVGDKTDMLLFLLFGLNRKLNQYILKE